MVNAARARSGRLHHQRLARSEELRVRLWLVTCDYGVRAMKSKLGTSNGGRLSLLSAGGRTVARPQVCHTHVAQPGARDCRRRCCSCAALVNIQEAMDEAPCRVCGLVGREYSTLSYFNVLQQKNIAIKKKFFDQYNFSIE